MGRGRLGEVYEAEEIDTNRVVALKLIAREFPTDATFRDHLQRAADIASRLREHHIVPIHGYGEFGGRFYIEMPMIPSASLRTLLTHYGAPAPKRAVAIVRQIATALDAAHASGIDHGDVKPGNILVTDEYAAFLADLGTAEAAINFALARHSTALEVFNYLAPERFAGDVVTHSSDIYALASVLYECLTGTPPFPADNVEQLMVAHLDAPIPRPTQLGFGIPPLLDLVIAKGMAKDPMDRYDTAGELAAATHEALTIPGTREQAVFLRRQGNTLPMTASDAAPPSPGVDDSSATRSPESTTPASATLPPWIQHTAARGDRWSEPPSAELNDRARAGSTHAWDFGALTPFTDKRKLWPIIGAVAVLTVVIVAAVLLISRPSSPSRQASPPHQTSGQVVLPFNGLNFRLSPGGVAVDKSGTVYVTNQGMYGRVVALAPGSSAPTVELFRGLYEPQGVAVDNSGTVYVTDFNNRVLALAAGSSSQVELPFVGLNYPEGVAVDSQGSVYVADRGNNQVVKLPAGSRSQVVLPFDGLKNPDGVAVDLAGNVYVTDTDNDRVVRLNAGSDNQTVLPMPALSAPWGIAVDNAGNVFVTEHDANAVVKFAAGSSAPTVLRFMGLNTPSSVTVDNRGNVYVADRGEDSVLKLAL
jgi:serine/threonine-protein kinase